MILSVYVSKTSYSAWRPTVCVATTSNTAAPLFIRGATQQRPFSIVPTPIGRSVSLRSLLLKTKRRSMLSAMSTLMRRSLVVASSRRCYTISAPPSSFLPVPVVPIPYFTNPLPSAWTAMWEELSVWNMSSTRKKRVKKMNKHKLRKRRKKDRLKTRKQ